MGTNRGGAPEKALGKKSMMGTRPDAVERQPAAGSEASQLKPRAPDCSPTKHGRENIKVVVRIRPLLVHETGQAAVVTGEGNVIHVDGASSHRQLQRRYDAVIGSEASQEDMFSHVRECASAVLEGENSTIFAYGQTGSGKTYTMFGPGLDADGCAPPGYGKGVVPLAVADLFTGLNFAGKAGDDTESSVWVSFVQLYNEQLYDMLRDPQRTHPLAIHGHATAGIYVQGLSEYAVHSAGECLELLRVGREQRAIRETHMNQASSRSHSIFQIVVEQKRRSEEDGERVLRSKFNLVDLAGSEKWDVKQDMEEIRVNEMTNINVSLHTLGRVIAALSTPNSHGGGGTRRIHIPYRDSKLTRLLQDSLGGNTRTRIIATLSPASQCLDETLSTLRFADRAKQVMAFVRVNEHRPVDHALVHRLQAEVKHLKDSLRRAALDQKRQTETPSTPPRPAVLTALAEAQLLGYQNTIEQLRRENTALRQDPNPKETVQSSIVQEQRELDFAALQAANRALEGAIKHIVMNIRRFFRFDIEEEDLREDLAKVLSQLSGSLPGRASWCTSPISMTSDPRFASAVIQSARRGRDVHDYIFPGNGSVLKANNTRGVSATQQSRSAVTTRGQACQGLQMQSADVTLPPVSGVTAERDAKSEILAYRVRGKHANEVVEVMKKELTEEDEERKLRKELKLAKERMKKNLQLQEWLLQKEQREIEMLAMESEKRDEADRDRRRKDEEFRRRAAKQKAKLKRFYETAQMETRKEAERRDLQKLEGRNHAITPSADSS